MFCDVSGSVAEKSREPNYTFGFLFTVSLFLVVLGGGALFAGLHSRSSNQEFFERANQFDASGESITAQVTDLRRERPYVTLVLRSVESGEALEHDVWYTDAEAVAIGDELQLKSLNGDYLAEVETPPHPPGFVTGVIIVAASMLLLAIPMIVLLIREWKLRGPGYWEGPFWWD